MSYLSSFSAVVGVFTSNNGERLELRSRAGHAGASIVKLAATGEARLSDIEPIVFRLRATVVQSTNATPAGGTHFQGHTPVPLITRFDRLELRAILNLYGRMVAAGEWRDYAMDFLKEKAVFSVYRRSSEFPLYRIEKVPKLARKQGAYSVVAATGLILKRGHELHRVLAVLDRRLEAVEG